MYIIDNEDIWIESTTLLNWVQRFDDGLVYDNLYINSYDYTDYRPTRLQFHISSATVMQVVNFKINYANRLSATHVKHLAVGRYDDARKQWVIVPHTLNEKERKIEVAADRIGVYCVFVNHYWYSTFTQRMADEYPNWTEIRQSKESNGQLFLNYFGVELETITDYLNWIHDQRYIQTADTYMLDWIHMYQLPDVMQTDSVRVLSGNVEIPILDELKDFFNNDRNRGGLLDYQESKLYIVRDEGNLILEVTRQGIVNQYPITPMDYNIWNSFDEFGLKLGLKRLHLENNADYKERLLDVFRYPSATTEEGITNGIARDLGLINRKDKNGKVLTWSDDKKDLLLKNTKSRVIDIRTLRIDDKPLRPDQYKLDALGNIQVLALNQGKSHSISFIHGIEKYQLYDRKDEALHKIAFEQDGQATSTLLKWVEYINTVAPVMWDRFNWDEGFWDTIDEKLTGLGYVPNIWDSDIEIWKDYTFESDR